MIIINFAKTLIETLNKAPIPNDIINEADFERRFVIPVITGLTKYENQIALFGHPWGSKSKCQPDCKSALLGKGTRQLGCPVCWKESKSWASVDAFGTRNTFDLICKDNEGHTLAIEVKWVSKMNGRMPNGELQRLFGQCLLAASKHDVVIGFCAMRGCLNTKYEKDTLQFKERLEKHNILMLIRNI